MDNIYMTEVELAEYLKVSTKTIQRLRRKGLPFAKMMGTVRYKKASVDKWMQELEEECSGMGVL